MAEIVNSFGKTLNRMLEDISNGKINGVIVQNFEQLVRENFEKTESFVEYIKNNKAKIITLQDGNLQDIIEVIEQLKEKYLTDIKKMAQKIKRAEIKKQKNKNKQKDR